MRVSRRQTKFVSLLLLGVSSASLTTAAAAQTAASNGATANAADAGTGLAEIIVTGQRRSEQLQDVPLAVSAFTKDMLASAGVDSTRDLQLITPSLSTVQAAYAPQPTIRGVGARGVNAGDEQVVPIFIDGVYQPFIVGGIFELNDVERIEVQKGPQGILQGRNATGGTINIITETPVEGFKAFARAGYGSFDEVRLDGYVSGGSERVRGSLSIQYLDDGGYVRKSTGGRTAEIRSLTLRGKLLFELSEQTTLTLAANTDKRDDNTAIVSYPLNGNNAFRAANPTTPLATKEPRILYSSFPPFLNTKQQAGSATIVHEFGFADLTSISSYSDNELNFKADIDLTVLPLQFLQIRQTEKAFVQDTSLVSTGTGPFKWIIGGFYMDDKAAFNPRFLNTIGLVAKYSTEAYAFYAQGSYDFNDVVSLTFGGRYSHDRKCGETAGINQAARLAKFCKSWERFNPSATLDVQVAERTKVYLRYATAFKSGVFNATTFSTKTASPEDVTSYEIGLKSDLTRWLRFNGAAFYTDYENLQVSARDPVTTSVFIQNAAQGEILGFEGEFFVKPTQNLNLRAGFSLLETNYKKFLGAVDSFPRVGGGNVSGAFDASGLRLVRVPETTATLGFDYTVPQFAGGRLTIASNLYYEGGFNWNLSGRLRQPKYALVNANITWRSDDEHYEVKLWAKNITDADPFLTLTTSVVGDTAVRYRPTTFGASAKYIF